MPDKVIRWLDTACVKAEITDPNREVDQKKVISVIAQDTNIPLDMIRRDTLKQLRDIEEEL